MEPIEEENGDDVSGETETIEAATKRLTRMSALGRPDGASVLEHPECKSQVVETAESDDRRNSTLSSRFSDMRSGLMETVRRQPQSERKNIVNDGRYVAALTTEPPNPSVHTFSGKLTLPPFDTDAPCMEIPLGAENVLLRGAVVRNTEWVIGLAFFTGTDTKLIQNSFETPSKFSQLDRLMNWTVVGILCIMVGCISYLSTQAVITNNDKFDQLWYAGYNKDANAPWPFLPDLPPPEWETGTNNWFQFFFLYVTLLNNFVPLSLYVTVEFITFCMLWFIYVDLDMYDDTTNTRAVARSTTVTDLGRVQYIFSDKTGTLTQNVMRFKRCSVDGIVFGAPIQRARPGAEPTDDDSSWLPLRQLLVGRLQQPSGLEGLGGESPEFSPSDLMTFNAEMFLRVMSLCHTVVVEKDIDNKKEISGGASVSSSSQAKSSFLSSVMGRKRANTNGSGMNSPLSSVNEGHEIDLNGTVHSSNRGRTSTVGSMAPGENSSMRKNGDGAPIGFAYQAESPDEGALVSAASSTYGFQVVSRDSSGIRLRATSPSHLQSARVTDGCTVR